jgi:hypothetical protein
VQGGQQLAAPLAYMVGTASTQGCAHSMRCRASAPSSSRAPPPPAAAALSATAAALPMRGACGSTGGCSGWEQLCGLRPVARIANRPCPVRRGCNSAATSEESVEPWRTQLARTSEAIAEAFLQRCAVGCGEQRSRAGDGSSRDSIPDFAGRVRQRQRAPTPAQAHPRDQPAERTCCNHEAGHGEGRVLGVGRGEALRANGHLPGLHKLLQALLAARKPASGTGCRHKWGDGQQTQQGRRTLLPVTARDASGQLRRSAAGRKEPQRAWHRGLLIRYAGAATWAACQLLPGLATAMWATAGHSKDSTGRCGEGGGGLTKEGHILAAGVFSGVVHDVARLSSTLSEEAWKASQPCARVGARATGHMRGLQGWAVPGWWHGGVRFADVDGGLALLADLGWCGL